MKNGILDRQRGGGGIIPHQLFRAEAQLAVHLSRNLNFKAIFPLQKLKMTINILYTEVYVVWQYFNSPHKCINKIA